MKVACPECGCVVDEGVVIVPCADYPDCCCGDLPACDAPSEPAD